VPHGATDANHQPGEIQLPTLNAFHSETPGVGGRVPSTGFESPNAGVARLETVRPTTSFILSAYDQTC